jgi:hypothetical protein
MLSFAPDCVYLTHYGRLGDVAALGAAQLRLLDEVVAMGHRLATVDNRHAALIEGLSQIYRADLRRQGSGLSDAEFQRLMGLDLELNAQGMGVWLDRMQRQARA